MFDAHRVRVGTEDHRNRLSGNKCGSRFGGRWSENHFAPDANEFLGKLRQLRGFVRPSKIKNEVSAFDVPKVEEPRSKSLHARRKASGGGLAQIPDPRDLCPFLRYPFHSRHRQHERRGSKSAPQEFSPGLSHPRSCQRAERLRPPHSITSSARARSVGGIVRFSAFAVVRLTTRSNRIACSIGRSAGLAPFRTLSTKTAA